MSLNILTSLILGSSSDKGQNRCSWYNLNESSSEPQYLYNDTKTLYDPCPAGWKTPHRTMYVGWNINQGYWFDEDGKFRATGNTAHKRGGRLYNISGQNGVPSPRTKDNTAWFPATAYRSFVKEHWCLLAVVRPDMKGQIRLDRPR